jgi:glycerate kinase
VELAQASGLVLLKERERSALRSSTYGTGIQVRHAIEIGATTVYIGLGGSATNDGGTGIARALGYRFLDNSGKELAPRGENLIKMASINADGVSPGMKYVSLIAVNDVTNPLYGPEGAAHVYAAQKGATAVEIAKLDEGLRHLDSLVSRELGKKLAQIPGTGAAGGTSYGLRAFFGAAFLGGTQFVLQMVGIPELLRKHKIDFMLTGEGKIDRQTLSGKLISGVLELGLQNQIPVIALCGKLEVGAEELKAAGITDVIEVSERDRSLQYNMTHAKRLLHDAAYHYFKNRI